MSGETVEDESPEASDNSGTVVSTGIVGVVDLLSYLNERNERHLA